MGFLASGTEVSRFFFPWKKTKPKKLQNWPFTEGKCIRFSLNEIRTATDDFKEYLGSGVFSDVYKGHIINDGTSMVVAIKRLIKDNQIQPESAFDTEILLFCQLRHPNLVSFIGFCEEGDDRMLVYEFLDNGPLSNHLFGKTAGDPLSWKKRLDICIGAARGVHYLHTGMKRAIIHRDLKSFNILLDKDMVPKLSALGLGKLGGTNVKNKLNKASSRKAGTLGYADPEYLESGNVTHKSDVFAFGVVLFEVLCVRSAAEFIECMDGTLLFDIIDPYLKGKIAPDCLRKFVDIAERCVRRTGAQRPTIGEVEVELEDALELQEKSDSSKNLETSTSISPAHQDYTYDGMTFRTIKDIFFWLEEGTLTNLVSTNSQLTAHLPLLTFFR
ncbi:receptor-like protein kinase ANXUR2 [Rosa sericea]